MRIRRDGYQTVQHNYPAGPMLPAKNDNKESVMTRRIIRVDGTEEALDRPHSMKELYRLMGCQLVDTVNLRHLGEPRQVMLVDDTGMIDRKPVNQKATALYHANCRPGVTAPICGDVAIVFDEDFA